MYKLLVLVVMPGPEHVQLAQVNCNQIWVFVILQCMSKSYFQAILTIKIMYLWTRSIKISLILAHPLVQLLNKLLTQNHI